MGWLLAVVVGEGAVGEGVPKVNEDVPVVSELLDEGSVIVLRRL